MRGRIAFRGPIAADQVLNCSVLETQAPVNPGDSGGPVVDDRVQLVAVVSHSSIAKQLVSGNIDVTEVRAFVAKAAREHGFVWKNAAKLPLPGSVAESAVPKRLVKLDVADPAVRAEAVAWFGQMGPEGKRFLADILRSAADGHPAVNSAVAIALQRIGPATAAETDILAPHAASKSRAVRQYVFTAFAGPAAPPPTVAGSAAAIVADPDPGTRELAARVLARSGAAARPAAVPALFRVLDDPDQAVRLAVSAALDTYAPYTAEEAEAVSPTLRSVNAGARLLAVRVVASSQATADRQIADLSPLLIDASPEVRAAATGGVGQTQRGRASLTSDIGRLANDPAPEVRIALASVLGSLAADGDRSRAYPRLLELAQEDKSKAVRKAAADALAPHLREDPADFAGFRAVWKEGTPDCCTRIMTKLMKLGAKAEPLTPDLVRELPTWPPDTQLAAVGVLTAIGPVAAEAAVPALISLAAPTSSFTEMSTSATNEKVVKKQELVNRVPLIAVAALPKFGPAGIKALLALANRGDLEHLRPAFCDAIAAAGTEAVAASPTLFTWFDSTATIREKAGAALAALGAPAVMKELIKRTSFAKLRSGDGEYEAYAADLRAAAVRTLPLLDGPKLAPSDRVKLVEHLKYLKQYEKNAEIRKLAIEGLIKLRASD